MCASGYLNLTTWKAPKGLHSSIKLNVNIVKDVIASMAVVSSFVMLGTHHVIAHVIAHVKPMGLEGRRGCSRNNVGALLLLVRGQLHTRCVLGGWSSFQMPLAVEFSSSLVLLQSQSKSFEQRRGQGLG